ncbi:MAG: hypothetical protein NC548_31810 [Lachnospiraceae bacterium]|nr:hypothetical protein [Lachnospiraceae bacterium]
MEKLVVTALKSAEVTVSNANDAERMVEIEATVRIDRENVTNINGGVVRGLATESNPTVGGQMLATFDSYGSESLNVHFHKGSGRSEMTGLIESFVSGCRAMDLSDAVIVVGR